MTEDSRTYSPLLEIWRSQAVSIEEDAILADACANSVIADLRGAKSLLFVPHMLDRCRQARLPAFDDPRRLWTRSVISNDNLKVAVPLMGERSQAPIECVWTIVRADHHGDKIIQEPAPMPESDSRGGQSRRRRAKP